MIFLFCVIFSVIFPRRINAVSSRGYFISLRDEYLNYYKDQFHSLHMITKIWMNPAVSNATQKSYLRQCTHYCLKYEECTAITIYVNGTGAWCYVNSGSKCHFPTASLRNIVGYQTFDVRRAEEPQSIHSCITVCYATRGCLKCGRQNCEGKNCDDCKSTCWDINPTNGITYVWPDFAVKMTIQCELGWQLFHIAGTNSFTYWSQLDDVDLILVVRFGCEGENFTRKSYFDGFKANGSSITVGPYLGGYGGNYWQAPFENRELSTPQGLNCEKFWYPGTDCFEISKELPKQVGYKVCNDYPDSFCTVSSTSLMITKKTNSLVESLENISTC